MEPYLRSLPSECGNVIHRNTDSLFLASQIGQKRAREMWFLARFYSAQEAINMGLINTVVPVSC
jgi:1,4-dihydroxy-2-naphthoyl-CoA synthase